MRYNLTDLKLMIAIADTGSISKAADICFLAPSSVSLRIKRLEEALGARLLLRQARGVALTPAGRIMVKHSRTCLMGLEEMHAELAPYAEGIKAQVRLLATSSAVTAFLPQDLRRFLREYPEVRIAMHEKSSVGIIEALAEGGADIGVVNWAGEHPGLTFRPYHEDTLVAVMAPDHPLAKHSRLRFTECVQYPFVTLQASSAIYTFLTRKAAELGTSLDMRIQLSSFGSIIAIVGANAGISIVPLSALQNLNCGGIRIVSLHEPWARLSLRLCARPPANDTQSPYVGKLLDHLSEARNLAPDADQDTASS